MSGEGPEAIEFRAAKLPRGRHFFSATATTHRVRVERHRVFARADDDVTRGARQGRRAHSVGTARRSGLVLLCELILEPEIMMLFRPVEIDLTGSHSLEGAFHAECADVDMSEDH